MKTKIPLWFLRNYEDINHFWVGFNWAMSIGWLLSAIVGKLTLAHAIVLLFLTGTVLNIGMYYLVRSVAASLKNMAEGKEKDEAHNLMIQIIKRRIV